MKQFSKRSNNLLWNTNKTFSVSTKSYLHLKDEIRRDRFPGTPFSSILESVKIYRIKIV